MERVNCQVSECNGEAEITWWAVSTRGYRTGNEAGREIGAKGRQCTRQ